MSQSTVIQCLVIKKTFVLLLDVPVNNFSIMLGCNHFFPCVNHQLLKAWSLDPVLNATLGHMDPEEYSENPNQTYIFIHLVANWLNEMSM